MAEGGSGMKIGHEIAQKLQELGMLIPVTDEIEEFISDTKFNRYRFANEKTMANITGALQPACAKYYCTTSVGVLYNTETVGSESTTKLPTTQAEEYECLAWMLDDKTKQELEDMASGKVRDIWWGDLILSREVKPIVEEYGVEFISMGGDLIGIVTMEAADLAAEYLKRHKPQS